MSVTQFVIALALLQAVTCLYVSKFDEPSNMKLNELEAMEQNVEDLNEGRDEENGRRDSFKNEIEDVLDTKEDDRDAEADARELEELRDEDEAQERDGRPESEDDDDDDDDDDDASDDDDDDNEDARNQGPDNNGDNSVDEEIANEYENSVLERPKAATKTTYESCEKGMCELDITPMGCFHDSLKSPRPLPDLLDSHRDSTSHTHHGVTIDWKKGESSFRKLTCDCVRIARERNYTYIGLQHWGECWGGRNLTSNYARDGASTQCVNGKYAVCKKGEFCMGKEKTNYVYRIDPKFSSCSYEKVGCFYDPVTTHPRPLPELLDSHRDKHSNIYHGVTIEWTSYQPSLRTLVDHCAQRTKEKGYTHFGIEHYGECWSGPNSATTYRKYGNSTSCVNPDFKPCKSKCLCTGKEHALFVYKLK